MFSEDSFAAGNEGGRLFVAPGRLAGFGKRLCQLVEVRAVLDGRPPRPYNGLKLSVMRVMYHNVFGRKKPSRTGWLAFAFKAFVGRFCRQGIRHRRLRL